jgi:hypothetical protein
VLELWQTEWCPASRRIRERLTELGVDYVTRQVPVEKAIRRYLDEHVVEPPDAEAHRLKAAKARSRYLEEECECLQPATR